MRRRLRGRLWQIADGGQSEGIKTVDDGRQRIAGIDVVGGVGLLHLPIDEVEAAPAVAEVIPTWANV